MSKEIYNQWLNYEYIDKGLLSELKQLNEKEINDAFYTNIGFGTGGMRGIMGPGTNRINIYSIRKANYGFAKYLAEKQDSHNKGIAISYDNRHKSFEFAQDSANYLSGLGFKVYLFKTLAPTPELSFAVRHLKCAGGIMITASHNPKEYNGYKLYDENGCQLIVEYAKKVIDYSNTVDNMLTISSTANKELINMVDEEIHAAYYKEVLAIRINKDVNKNFKIIFSPQHGASKNAVINTLESAGYSVILVDEQASADGDFPNTKSPNPEDIISYDKSIEYAKKYFAELILVTDPDGDRMGVAVRCDNEYVLLDGNQTGAILMEYIFSQYQNKGIMPKNPIMYNTIVTSDIGEKVAEFYRVKTGKTLTGFKFIGDKIKNNIDKYNYVFGYEESYGSLISPFVRDKDANQACLMLAEACGYYLDQGKTLKDVINNLYVRLGYVYDHQTSIVMPGAEGINNLKKIINDLRENPITNIDNYKVEKYEDYLNLVTIEKGQKTPIKGFDSAEVLKYYFSDQSWISIRPSGTEPKCKIYYCIKGKDYKEAYDKFTLFSKFFSMRIK